MSTNWDEAWEQLDVANAPRAGENLGELPRNIADKLPPVTQDDVDDIMRRLGIEE